MKQVNSRTILKMAELFSQGVGAQEIGSMFGITGLDVLTMLYNFSEQRYQELLKQRRGALNSEQSQLEFEPRKRRPVSQGPDKEFEALVEAYVKGEEPLEEVAVRFGFARRSNSVLDHIKRVLGKKKADELRRQRVSNIKPEIDIEVLIEAYVKGEEPLSQIAARFGIPKGNVVLSRIRQSLGREKASELGRQRARNVIVGEVSPEELAEAYVGECTSLQTLAKQFGMSYPGRVERILTVAFGEEKLRLLKEKREQNRRSIWPRPTKWTLSGKWGAESPEARTICNEYISGEMALSQIAKIHGLSGSSHVLYVLKRVLGEQEYKRTRKRRAANKRKHQTPSRPSGSTTS